MKGPMNRIVLRYYTNRKEGPKQVLEVYNDIKGYSFIPIAQFHGQQAEIMYDLLSNVDYSKLENYMNYGIDKNGKAVK